MPEYEKGESSKLAKNNHDDKINYAYVDIDNVIDMIEPVEYLFMASSNDDKRPNYDAKDKRPKVFLKMRNAPQHHNDTRPKVVLRVAESSSSQSELLNVVTRGQSKVVLKVTYDPKNASSSKQPTTSRISNYDLVS